MTRKLSWRDPSGASGPRWTADAKVAARRRRGGTPVATDWNETDIRPDDGYVVCLPERPTATEARLWRLAGGDPAKYTDLVIEYSDEIAADREAGRFAPKTPKRR